MDHPGITVKAIWTMGDERTNEVYLDDVWVSDDYVVGEVNHGFQYISEALDLERFTLFTYSPIAQRLDLLTDYVATTSRDGEPLKDDAVVRSQIAHLHTEAEVARVLGLKFVFASSTGGVAAHRRGVRVQTVHHRILQASGRCLHGHRRCRGAVAGPRRRRPHGRSGRVDLPVHGDRHHRRRRLRNPEEHHRPAQARSPQELLSATAVTDPPTTDQGSASPGARAPPGPLSGLIVLDLASVGPAARCTRLLADYGATVVKVGAVPGRGAQPIRPPFYAYSGARYFDHVAIDLKDAEGRDAFLALVRTADVVVESFRPGVVDRLGIGFADLVAVNPGIILCSTTGYGQSGPRAAWAGHDINYLAVGGFLATSERRGDGGPPVPGATVADAAGGGLQAAMAIMAAVIGRGRSGVGVHLDVSIADGVLWLTSLAVDEYLATGGPVGPGRSMVTGRYACYDTYQAADGGWLAVGAIEPKFYANLCRLLGCEHWADHQLDDESQDKIRADFRAAFATRGRDEWVAVLAGRRHLRRPRYWGWTRWPTTTSTRPATPSWRRWPPPGSQPADGDIPRPLPPGGPGDGRHEPSTRAGGGRRSDPHRHRPPAGGSRARGRLTSTGCARREWWDDGHRPR